MKSTKNLVLPVPVRKWKVVRQERFGVEERAVLTLSPITDHGDIRLLTGLDGVRQPVQEVLVVHLVSTTKIIDV